MLTVLSNARESEVRHYARTRARQFKTIEGDTEAQQQRLNEGNIFTLTHIYAPFYRRIRGDHEGQRARWTNSSTGDLVGYLVRQRFSNGDTPTVSGAPGFNKLYARKI